MLRLRAYKTKLILNNEERSWCARCAGASRWCYNWGLGEMKAAYEQGRKTSVMAEKKRLNAIKDDIAPWLREMPYVVLQCAFDDLDAAYRNFFRRVKQGDAKAGFPRFKSRKRNLGRFRLMGSIHVTETQIRLPKTGWLRLAEHGYLPVDGRAKFLSATVSETAAGDWYVSLQVEEEVSEPEPAQGEPIGIDLGIHALAVLSDGTVYENPRHLAVHARKIARLSRELARRKQGSANWRKTKAKLAREHECAHNARRHMLHQISAETVAKEPIAIVMEDLNVKGMMANHHLARAISDLGMYELRRQMTYKATWNGSDVLLADTWYPSSKTCSACGHVRETLELDEREYICPHCGLVIDRDLNAAINLKNLA